MSNQTDQPESFVFPQQNYQQSPQQQSQQIAYQPQQQQYYQYIQQQQIVPILDPQPQEIPVVTELIEKLRGAELDEFYHNVILYFGIPHFGTFLFCCCNFFARELILISWYIWGQYFEWYFFFFWVPLVPLLVFVVACPQKTRKSINLIYLLFTVFYMLTMQGLFSSAFYDPWSEIPSIRYYGIYTLDSFGSICVVLISLAYYQKSPQEHRKKFKMYIIGPPATIAMLLFLTTNLEFYVLTLVALGSIGFGGYFWYILKYIHKNGLYQLKSDDLAQVAMTMHILLFSPRYD